MSQGTDTKVYISSFDFSQSALIEPILLEFTKKTGKSIKAENVNCNHHSTYDGDGYDLCIYVYSIFRGQSAHVERTDRLFGIDLKPGLLEFIELNDPAEVEHDTIFDPEGEVVAYILDRTLYITLNLGSRARFDDENNCLLKIWRAILDDYAMYYLDRTRFDEEMKVRCANREKKLFENVCKKQFDDCPSSSEEIYARSVEQYKRSISGNVRDRKRLVNKISVEVDKEQILRRYKKLCEFSETGEIYINLGSICVPVGQIDVEHKGKIYDIGRFEILIDFYRQDVRCTNTTRIRDGCFHPHVTREGNCCLGTISQPISDLLREKEVETIVLVMIEFLKSYNPEGMPFTTIKYWPKKVRKTKEVVK